VKPEEVKLAKHEYREGLKRIIEAKIAGEGIVAPAVEAPARVVNLMDALKKSLDAVSTKKKKPAKATVGPTGSEAQTRVIPIRSSDAAEIVSPTR